MGCCGLQGQYKQAVACSYETVLLGARTGREDIIANQTVEVRHRDRCGRHGGITAQLEHIQHPCLVKPRTAKQAGRSSRDARGSVFDAVICSTVACLCCGGMSCSSVPGACCCCCT